MPEWNESRLSPRRSAESTHETESREHVSHVDATTEERATHRERPTGPWIRATSLEAPPARDGYEQRWIRISIRGEDDPRNVNMRMREGWRPRDITTIGDEWQILAVRADAKGGHFVVDDLMLCEMPMELFQARQDYYSELTESQMAAVEHDLEDAQVDGHRIQRQHRSSVSHPARVVGRRVEARND